MAKERKNKSEEFIFPGFQKPNFTPVPDELFDQLAAHLSGAELRVLLYIIRRTFGFKKDSDDISLNQICHGIKKKTGEVLDQGTGLSQRHVIRALQGLIKKNIVHAKKNMSQGKGYEATTYSLNFLNGIVAYPFRQNVRRVESKMSEGLLTKSQIQETVLQETDNVNVGETLLNDKEAEEEALIDELVAQLGDRNHQSRKTYRQIIRALGPSIVWRLLGNTKEASRDGLIETTKAAYFTGMAKKVAQGQGVELGFRATRSRG